MTSISVGVLHFFFLRDELIFRQSAAEEIAVAIR
jgi:hypothetical protein